MQLSDLRAWHWMLIGLAVGLLLSWSQLSSDITTEFPLQRSEDQSDFERLIARSWSDTPRIRNTIVYPTNDRRHYLVSYQRLVDNRAEHGPVYHPYVFLAPEPYTTARRRGDIPRGKEMPFLEYLGAMQEQNQELDYTYAWWRDKRYVFPVWTGGSVLLIGVLWPLAIHLLMKWGWVPRPQEDPEYDLERFGHYEEPGRKRPAVATVDAEISRNLAAGIASGKPEEAPASPIRPLSTEPIEATGPQKQEQPKDYKGEFYPVAKSKPQ